MKTLMNDDWRLQIDFILEDRACAWIDALKARKLQHDLSSAYHDRVVVTRDGARVFLYAASYDQAVRSRDAIETDANKHGWKIDIALRRWHPAAEEWEDPDKAMPGDDVAKQKEREAFMKRERVESEARGFPEFEVRVDVPSHHDAARLDQRLREEGIPAVHRWKYLLVGATDEDSAKALAQRIRIEAPDGSQARVEGTLFAAYGDRAPNPFAVFRN